MDGAIDQMTKATDCSEETGQSCQDQDGKKHVTGPQDVLVLPWVSWRGKRVSLLNNVGTFLLTLLLTWQLVMITLLGATFKSSAQATRPHKKVIARKQEPAIRLVSLPRITSLKSEAKITESSRTKDQPTVSGGQAPAKKRPPLISNPSSWPPTENRPYPDMELLNQNGNTTRLSDLKGKVLVVQPVAMKCPVSQAFSGANQGDIGPLGLCFPTQRVRDFSAELRDFAGITVDSPELVLVQIIFYNGDNKPPALEDARLWANHFGLKTARNQYVLVANEAMVNRTSKLMIPGFHLVDRAFVLRCDSAGPLSKQDIYRHFFPALRSLFPSV